MLLQFWQQDMENLSFDIEMRAGGHYITHFFEIVQTLSPRPPREVRYEGTNLDVRGVLLHAW